MPSPKQPSREEVDLRARATLMLTAFEHAEPGPWVTEFHDILERTRGITRLRALLREFRSMAAGLPAAGRTELACALEAQFGPDPEFECDRRVVAQVRTRGRIRSEREYRAVQGYADAIAADQDAQEEYLALGALLDAYMAAP